MQLAPISGGDFRAEIARIQQRTLAKIGGKRPSFLAGLRLRFEEDFWERPLGDKLRFVRYILNWGAKRLSARLSRNPTYRPTPSGSRADNRIRVAIFATGSLGDYVSVAGFVKSLHRRHPLIDIDFFCAKPRYADFVFYRAEHVKQIYNCAYFDEVRDAYDLVVTVTHLVRYEALDQARIARLDGALAAKLDLARERFRQFERYFDMHPFLDGAFAREMASRGMNRTDALAFFGNLEIADNDTACIFPDVSKRSILATADLVGKRYITIANEFDKDYLTISRTATKCWPAQHWAKFVRLFKYHYPDILIVQLGVCQERRIEGVDVDLVGKTDLHEAAWLLRHSLVHIDHESGLVRLAHALQTRSVVMFGPTSASFFSFPANINIIAHSCHDCWWAKQDWMSFCPRGFEQPLCMHDISPQQVIDATAVILFPLDSTAAAD